MKRQEYEEEDWESDSEKRRRIEHKKVDMQLALMSREPSMDIFSKGLDISDKISISCIYENTAEIIRKQEPEIEKLYTEIDFNKIFKGELKRSLIRQCLVHFKPKKVILTTDMINRLPVDLFDAFTSWAPYELILKNEGFDQQFLMNIVPTKVIKLTYIHSKPGNTYDKAALTLTSMLQNMTNIESLNLIDCYIDDFAAVAIGKLCLEDLTLSNIQVQFSDIEILVRYITRQSFMKELRIRYLTIFPPNIRSFISQLINQIHRMSLKFLELPINNQIFVMDNIIRTPTLENVQINFEIYSSSDIINHIRRIISARPDISFEIHQYMEIAREDPSKLSHKKNNENLLKNILKDFSNVKSIKTLKITN